MEINSEWKNFFWKLFLIFGNLYLWKKVLLGNISFGNNFYGKKFSWKKFLNFTIFLEKNSVGLNVNGKKFFWKKIPKLAISWTNIQLEKISFGKIDIGKKFLRNYFFGKNYLGKIPLEITHWTFLQCAETKGDKFDNVNVSMQFRSSL